jgi:hypothetical protein
VSRESLGQVRIYRYTCDQCGLEVEHRIRGSRQITLPDGWSRVRVQVDENRTMQEAEVCSAKCARSFIDSQFTLDAAVLEEPTA